MTNLPGLVEVRITDTPWGDTTTAEQPVYSGRELCCGYHVRIRQRSVLQQPEGTVGIASSAPRPIHNQVGTFHTPYYEQWSFGIQQALGDKTSLALGLRGQPRRPYPDLQRGLERL